MPPDKTLPPTAETNGFQGDEWDGPWGSISPVPASVETLCIQIENQAGIPRIYYYPYRTIGKWHWIMDMPETLEIQARSTRITISGTGMRRLADALNLSQLRLVKLKRPLDLIGDICIKTILIDDLTNVVLRDSMRFSVYSVLFRQIPRIYF